MAMTIVEAPPGITGGVDTHLDTHFAAALDPLGRLVGTESFPADAAGYKALFGWLVPKLSASTPRGLREASGVSDAPKDPPVITPGPLVGVDDPNDPRLDLYRDLNDPAGRIRLDSDQSVFVVEGRLAVDRLLTSEYTVRSLLVDDHQKTAASDLVAATRARGAPVFVGSPDVVAGTVGFALHRGVVAVASRPEAVDARSVVVAARRAGGIDGGPPVVAVLEGLNDYENIGALFRN